MFSDEKDEPLIDYVACSMVNYEYSNPNVGPEDLLFIFTSCCFLFAKVPKISQEVKMEDLTQGVHSLLLATLVAPLLNVAQSKVSMMIPIILAGLLSRQKWLLLFSALPFVGSFPAISFVCTSHILQKSSKSQIAKCYLFFTQ